MYDVLLGNGATAGRQTDLYRLIILGEPSFIDEEIVKFISFTFNQVNSSFNYERVTGLLLYYKKNLFTVKTVSLMKLISFLKLSNLRVLMHLSYSKERFVQTFFWFTSNPEYRSPENTEYSFQPNVEKTNFISATTIPNNNKGFN